MAGKQSRSVVHATFRLERRYRAAPAAVFRALTDPAAKSKWFAGGEGYTLLARHMDVRPGGRELQAAGAGTCLVLTEQGASCSKKKMQ